MLEFPLLLCLPVAYYPLGNGQPVANCGVNEEFRTCGTHCEPMCDSPPNRPCILSCKVNVCQCVRGYVRGPRGVCILPSQCPSSGSFPRSCPAPNEELKTCGTPCEPSCSNPMPICVKRCVPNVCQCRRGYVRNDNNGRCVRRAFCPQPNPLDFNQVNTGLSGQPTQTYANTQNRWEPYQPYNYYQQYQNQNQPFVRPYVPQPNFYQPSRFFTNSRYWSSRGR